MLTAQTVDQSKEQVLYNLLQKHLYEMTAY